MRICTKTLMLPTIGILEWNLLHISLTGFRHVGIVIAPGFTSLILGHYYWIMDEERN